MLIMQITFIFDLEKICQTKEFRNSVRHGLMDAIYAGLRMGKNLAALRNIVVIRSPQNVFAIKVQEFLSGVLYGLMDAIYAL